MNRVLFYLSLSFLINQAIFVQGQKTTFSRVLYDIQQNGIIVNSLVRSFDNEYLLAGEFSFKKGIIIKVDSAGSVKWNKTFSTNPDIYPDVVFNCITSTNDSCFVIAGSASNDAGNQTDAFCVKINFDGDTLWSKAINFNGIDHMYAVSVLQTNDSGYIMTGYTSEYDPPSSRIFTAKLDKYGNLQWTNILTGGNVYSVGSSVKQTPDSGYVITGYLENYPPYTLRAFLLKLSPSGTFSWAKKYHLVTSVNCTGNDIMITDNGVLCYLNIGNNVALMKTDFSGNILWSKSYTQPSNNYALYNSIQKLHKTSDSNFVFVSGDCWGSGMTKIDSAGNIILGKSLLLTAVDVIESENKELFIVGNPMCGVKQSQYLPSHIGIIRTDSLGNTQECVFPKNVVLFSDSIITTSISVTALSGGVANDAHPVISSLSIGSYSGCVDIPSGIDEANPVNDLLVFPNPVSTLINIKTDNTENKLIRICDVYNRVILEIPTNESLNTMDVSSFTAGIYFLMIKYDHFIVYKRFCKL